MRVRKHRVFKKQNIICSTARVAEEWFDLVTRKERDCPVTAETNDYSVADIIS